MNKFQLLFAAAPIALATPAFGQDRDSTQAGSEAPSKAAQVFSTGVAKGRDRLDSAISTSSLSESDVQELGPRSVAEILRIIPGVRSEAANGFGDNSISIRGLPIASTGSKFLQLQEDGLPILEFGDIAGATADTFLRADLNLAQVEAIRGGSASTFASNSPGGIINFISKTGTVAGGAIQTTAGLDYDMYRADFDYGAPISDTLRFHIGGFYRQGEGPRDTGFTALKGGQVKLNVTKDFAGGYIRFYGKYLDDRTPLYNQVPIRVTGTNDDPNYENIANFDVRNGTALSRYFTSNVTLDGQNNVRRNDIRGGQHAIVKSFGVESQVDLGEWSVTERFRFADMSNHTIGYTYILPVPGAALSSVVGVPGATYRYATGPNTGAAITDLASLNGNGLLALQLLGDGDFTSLDNVTNDLRVSRVWQVGGGKLTTTAGFYASRQTIAADTALNAVISDVRGDGTSALVDVVGANGQLRTQDGYFAFQFPGSSRRSYNINYRTNAPFGSVNYHIGKLAIGASVRYDFGQVDGTLLGAELGGGRVGTAPRDMNGDGVISPVESRVGVTPLTRPAPLNYDYGYLSYSAGVNYRVSEPVAVFARYSRGGRANADRLLYSPVFNTNDGSLVVDTVLVDLVKQAEGGVKFRGKNVELNLTGFWAEAEDTNVDASTGAGIARVYQAKGLEFEGRVFYGPFSLTGGATYTDAEIKQDLNNPAVEGNRPRRQPKFMFQVIPEFTSDRFTVGAAFVGATDTFAVDTNQLKVPGYVTTNAFVQFRPLDRVTLGVNADNLFNVIALTSVDDDTVPAGGGIVRGHVLNGRTISASLRFDF